MGKSGEKSEYNACLFTPKQNVQPLHFVFLNETPVFIGEYAHNLDEKGRLAIPKKFRDDLSKGGVVTRGLDDCLFVYTKKEWTILAEKLSSLPFSQANTRAFARLMLAGAMEIELDSQGRIMVPEYLRTYATLHKEIVVAGLYNRVELWDATKWKQYTAHAEADRNRIAEELGALGV